MALDAEARQKIQIILLLGVIIAGARAGYIVYERYEERKEVAPPKQVPPLKADYYVTPKKLHPYDLKSAHDLTKQPVWARLGGQVTYYPYSRAEHKTEWAHAVGALGPLQKLEIEDVVTDVAPKAAGTKQVMATFAVDGKQYAAPIGIEKDGDFKIYSDEIFFIEDPHELYKHWAAEVWKAIDEHQAQLGMSELQVSFALGLGIPTGSGGDYGWRTSRYANVGKPVTIKFENDKAVEINSSS
jgi:hypothetical protein